MQTRHAISILIAVAVAFGIADAYFTARGLATPRPVELSFSIVLMVTGYLWYRHDSKVSGYHGSIYLGGAIAFFSIVALPYYLYRSRVVGNRAGAMLRFFGLLLLFPIIGILVSALYEFMHTG